MTIEGGYCACQLWFARNKGLFGQIIGTAAGGFAEVLFVAERAVMGF